VAWWGTAAAQIMRERPISTKSAAVTAQCGSREGRQTWERRIARGAPGYQGGGRRGGRSRTTLQDGRVAMTYGGTQDQRRTAALWIDGSAQERRDSVVDRPRSVAAEGQGRRGGWWLGGGRRRVERRLSGGGVVRRERGRAVTQGKKKERVGTPRGRGVEADAWTTAKQRPKIFS
jgi:hypothetical protein